MAAGVKKKMITIEILLKELILGRIKSTTKKPKLRQIFLQSAIYDLYISFFNIITIN